MNPSCARVLGAGRRRDARVLGRDAGGQFRGEEHPARRRDPARRACSPAARGKRRARCTPRDSARSRPARDDKILASWNGLMLRGIAEAARAFGDERYRDAGGSQRRVSVRARWCGTVACFARTRTASTRIAGFLEDHAARGARRSLAVYELTFDRRGSTARATLCRRDGRTGSGTTRRARSSTPPRSREAHHAPARRHRQRDAVGHVARGGAARCDSATCLAMPDYSARATFVARDARRADGALPARVRARARAPDMVVNGAVEVAIVGDPAADDFKALERAVGESYVPSLVLAGGRPGHTRGIALLKDRPMRMDAQRRTCVAATSAQRLRLTPRSFDQLASLAGTEAKRLAT